MVLLAAEDADEVLAPPAEADDDGQQVKAQLDDSGISRATKKVDLDLDDAPFLEDEEEEEEELEDLEPVEHDFDDDEESAGPSIFQNKLFYIALVVILLLVGVIAYLLMREPAPAPPPVEPVAEEQPATPEMPEPETPEPDQTLVRLDPFWIEATDDNGEIRFLIIRINFATYDDQLVRNFVQETLTVRNALYYYLRNKDLEYLTDEENVEQLKQELLGVVNQYMAAGQFETLLFEQYLVR